jgi:hypothetical protein
MNQEIINKIEEANKLIKESKNMTADQKEATENALKLAELFILNDARLNTDLEYYVRKIFIYATVQKRDYHEEPERK